MTGQWNNSRKLKERILIHGDLVLETPAHFGAGEAGSLLDMPLLRDGLDGQALLTGASIAGALRGYLLESELPGAESLFGDVNGGESNESLLLVDDALGGAPEIEVRDNVAIDPKTRTAKDGKKFDMELLASGAVFPLHFELLVQKGDEDLIETLASALKALENGDIRLGKRKRRGFGQCRVKAWRVNRYPVDQLQGMLDWLANERRAEKTGPQIDRLLLGRELAPRQPKRWCRLRAVFALDGSLIIRSAGEAGGENTPDAVHLRSKRNGVATPIISGTSLAGAMRSRALRIANTLGMNGESFTDHMFGAHGENDQTPSASRLWVDESVISGSLDRIQNRIKIDRFTGGAYPGALFNEQPVFGGAASRVELNLRLQNAQPCEVGLLLLLLKDLWTGELPLGGESNIGRGRLQGLQAELFYNDKTWTLAARPDGSLAFSGDGEKSQLQDFVDAFINGGGYGKN